MDTPAYRSWLCNTRVFYTRTTRRLAGLHEHRRRYVKALRQRANLANVQFSLAAQDFRHHTLRTDLWQIRLGEAMFPVSSVGLSDWLGAAALAGLTLLTLDRRDDVIQGHIAKQLLTLFGIVAIPRCELTDKTDGIHHTHLLI